MALGPTPQGLRHADLGTHQHTSSPFQSSLIFMDKKSYLAILLPSLLLQGELLAGLLLVCVWRSWPLCWALPVEGVLSTVIPIFLALAVESQNQNGVADVKGPDGQFLNLLLY